MDVLPHVAFALVAISFAVRDILWLRCLAIVASAVAISFEGQQWLTGHEYRIPNVTWHTLFVGINGYQVWHLVYGERHVRFSEEERALYEGVFRSLTKLEFKSVLRIAQWRTAEPGTVLARQDEPLTEVIYVCSGIAAVEVDGECKAKVTGGQFIGEMSFVTGDNASATVRVSETLRFVAWPKSALGRMLARNPSIRFALLAIMGVDMSRKLKKSSGERD